MLVDPIDSGELRNFKLFNFDLHNFNLHNFNLHILTRLDQFEITQLIRHEGVTDFSDLKGYRAVRILKQHFKSGEWGKKRCGSVVTTMVDNVSRYCIVDRFFTVQQKSFALVRWLAVPTYPMAPNPLVVEVTFPTTPQPSRLLPVERIIPTHVSVLPVGDGVFRVMRDKGTDRTAFT